jgi:hypothetical protein
VREIETDYLVVGAGASGLAFVDVLLSRSDADVVLVDRRDRPGGHWLDAYPFVRLHQPSAYYGVASRPLGSDRIDVSGPNAGFYERATPHQICDHFGQALDDFVASGRVRFLAMSDYRGRDGDGHHVTSLITGADTTIRAKKVVDATYVESEIPSRHTPSFSMDSGVRLMPPNNLVDLAEAPAGFTVIGAGKTAMDTCNWLLDNGVDPDRITWFRPRDPWLFNRTFMQPLDLVGSYMQMQARWVEAAAVAESSTDFAHRLAADDVFLRIDADVEPTAFRGATISTREIEQLRSIQRVVTGQRVRHIGTHQIATTAGDVPTDARNVYVDCTAQGVRPTAMQPLFEGDRVTLEYVTIGVVPWSAASVAAIETSEHPEAQKNQLTPVVRFTGNAADLLDIAHCGMTGLTSRGADADFAAWDAQCRLNPSSGASQRAADPQVAAAFASIMNNIGPALNNLAARVPAALAASPV